MIFLETKRAWVNTDNLNMETIEEFMRKRMDIKNHIKQTPFKSDVKDRFNVSVHLPELRGSFYIVCNK